MIQAAADAVGEVTSAYGLVALLITTTIGPTAVMIVRERLTRGRRRTQEQRTAEIHNEVKNTHSTNLRHDVDRALTAIDRVHRVQVATQQTLTEMLGMISRDQTGLHEDVRAIGRRLDGHDEDIKALTAAAASEDD